MSESLSCLHHKAVVPCPGKTCPEKNTLLDLYEMDDLIQEFCYSEGARIIILPPTWDCHANLQNVNSTNAMCQKSEPPPQTLETIRNTHYATLAVPLLPRTPLVKLWKHIVWRDSQDTAAMNFYKTRKGPREPSQILFQVQVTHGCLRIAAQNFGRCVCHFWIGSNQFCSAVWGGAWLNFLETDFRSIAFKVDLGMPQ